jgi:serine/threonine protein kinase
MPELGYGPSKVSEKGDVYSYGVVLLELLTGRRASGAESGGPSLLEWVRGKLTSRHEVTNSLFFFNSADEDKSGSATCSEVSQKELREMLVVLKLALRCTDRVAMLRPSMKEAVDILEDVWRRGGYQIAAKSGPSKHRKKIEEDAQQSLPSPGDSFRLELCRAEFAGR